MNITVVASENWNYWKLPGSEQFRPVFDAITENATKIVYIHRLGRTLANYFIVNNLAHPDTPPYRKLEAPIAEELGIPNRDILLNAFSTLCILSEPKIAHIAVENYGLLKVNTVENGQYKVLIP
jgi:hypothetical protein